MILTACAGKEGHISHPSKIAKNIIPEHNLHLIADRSEQIKADTDIQDEKIIAEYQQKHTKTVICKKNQYYAATEANIDQAQQKTLIGLLNGEHILVSQICFIENAKPEHSTYYSIPAPASEKPTPTESK